MNPAILFSASAEDEEWFRDHVQPHEQLLRAWLQSRFTDHRDIDDVVQEAFARMWRHRQTGTIASPKAFLFVAARNVVLDSIRKVASHREFYLADLDEMGLVDESEDVGRAVARAEELELLTQAIQSLPDRCRQIITLRRIYGLPQKEIARELNISVNTVETQGCIGMRKLAEFFAQVGREKSGDGHA